MRLRCDLRRAWLAGSVRVQLMLTIAAAIGSSPVRAQEAGVCAIVKVKLSQSVTLTRSAFRATLQLGVTEGSAGLAELRVVPKITDGSGADVTSRFGLKAPVLTNVGDVDGTGVVEPGTTATASWTIVPTRDAAPVAPTTYYVGGDLSYTQGGKAIAIKLYPAPIVVKPDPWLQFHYFWQRDVYSDDPFTKVIEPAEAFSVGVIVANAGYGTARDMRIASAQPEIVENDKGLLIQFKIIGSQVDRDAVSPSLTVDLGDVAPQSTAVARWLMTSTLMGKFIAYTAEWKHVDDLGNARTSLVDSVDIHELDHVVRVDLPEDDKRPDFLANDIPDPDDMPDMLWKSDATTEPVNAGQNVSITGPIGPSVTTATLTARAPADGWLYIRAEDPGQEKYRLLDVIRSDGRHISICDNAWTTHRNMHPLIGSFYRQHRVHVFDYNNTGSDDLTYTLVYGDLEPAEGSLGIVKQEADGRSVSSDGIVTARFSDGIYVERADRSCGMKVTPNLIAVGQPVGTPRITVFPDWVQEGVSIHVDGVMRTGGNAERYIEASAIANAGAGYVPPIGITTKPLYCGDFYFDASTGSGQRGMYGGSGLNNVGLLVLTIGKVTDCSYAEKWFSLDDGYGRPVKVRVPSDSGVATAGTYAAAVGVVSIEKTDLGLLLPILRVRRASDLLYDPVSLLGQAFVSPAGLLQIGDNPYNNEFSIPGIPLDPLPTSVLGMPQVLLAGSLARYDAPGQQEIYWDPLDPSRLFNLVLGEGYRVASYSDSARAAAFSGLRTVDNIDQWVGLPVLGATRIGHPFQYTVNWADVMVSDGTKMVSLTEAARQEFPPWLDSTARYFDISSRTDRVLGLEDDTRDTTLLMPWQAYWVLARRDSLALVVPAQAAVLGLARLSPSSAVAGGSGFTLTVSGSGFVAGSTVYWNGSARTTQYVSPWMLTALVPASDIKAAGSALVTVINPAPRAGASKALTFTIGVPRIAIGAISSSSRSGGGIALTFTLTNTGTADAAGVKLTSSALGSAKTTTSPLPSLGNIPIGGSQTVTLTYPSSAGAKGATVVLSVAGSYSGGSFTCNSRAKLP